MPERADNEGSEANRIAWIGLIVQIILGLFTILLFYLSYKANQTAQDGIIQAKRANDVNQKQFESLNQPFLQMWEPTIQNLAVGQLPVVASKLRNLSDIPAELISSKSISAIADHEPPMAQMAAQSIVDFYNKYYITKDAPVDDTYQIGFPIEVTDYEGLQNGNLFLYTYRHIEYKNLITGKIRIFQTYVRFRPVSNDPVHPSGVVVHYMHLSNFDKSTID